MGDPQQRNAHDTQWRGNWFLEQLLSKNVHLRPTWRTPCCTTRTLRPDLLDLKSKLQKENQSNPIFWSGLRESMILKFLKCPVNIFFEFTKTCWIHWLDTTGRYYPIWELWSKLVIFRLILCSGLPLAIRPVSPASYICSRFGWFSCHYHIGRFLYFTTFDKIWPLLVTFRQGYLALANVKSA